MISPGHAPGPFSILHHFPPSCLALVYCTKAATRLPTPPPERCQTQGPRLQQRRLQSKLRPRGVWSSLILANERQRLDAANRKAARAAERVFQTLCPARRHGVLRWAVGLGASENLGPSCWVGLANTTFRPQPAPSAVPPFPGVRVEIPAWRSPESLQSWAAGPHRAKAPRFSWFQPLAAAADDRPDLGQLSLDFRAACHPVYVAL